jgi:CheY-like chemotaxis protein
MDYKILCVDDDPNILDGYKRSLRKDFNIYTAEGGREGLSAIAKEGPFAVVISDMRMPVMDGIQFLCEVKKVAPQTVRMMLTGNADQQTAIDAVNEGNIFRFLTKPCFPEALSKAIGAGIDHHCLITAEKELLEETLNKSLQVLVDILALVNPTAFNRSNRVKKLARQIAENLGVKNAWEVEFAAMLSKIGCVTVSEEILQKISRGENLTEKEAGLYQRNPQIGHDLIAKIPRMRTVAEIIAHQNKGINEEITSELKAAGAKTVITGARILKVVFDFDKLLQTGHFPQSAYHELADQAGIYDPIVLNSLRDIIDREADEYVLREMFVVDLKPGMILSEALYSTRDSLLLSAGQEITPSLILRLVNFAEAGFISRKVGVNVPVGALQEATVTV